MKTYVGAEALATALVYFAKSGFRPSFFDGPESLRQMRGLFGDFSAFDVLRVTAFLPARMVRRSVEFIARKFAKGKRNGMRFKFSTENFLDAEGRFTE